VVHLRRQENEMIGLLAAARNVEADPAADFDAVVIGAGVFRPLPALQAARTRPQGVFETGTGIGGTWYWNRYPGARFDAESYTRGYSFSQKLLEEWNWADADSGNQEECAVAPAILPR
jgi:cation diffusion facilitator CzcD-associated flavoprotein CzcO